jgi:ABC-type polysaccharide/polyol phosphate export permease
MSREGNRRLTSLRAGASLRSTSAVGSASTVRSPIREYVRSVWQARDLLSQLTLRDIRIRYKQAVMGFAWAILMPMLIIGAGTLVRFAMAYVGQAEIDARVVQGMAVKAFPWAFFVGAVGFATGSLTGSIELVTKVSFPRVVLPLSATLAQAFDTAIGVGTAALLLPLLGWRPELSVGWVPLLALVALLLTAGIALVLACANLFFRDVKYLVQVGLTFGIFLTPVFFEPQMFGGLGSQLMMLNPLAPILEGLRLCVVEGHDLAETLWVVGQRGETVLVWTPWYLVYSSLWAVLAALASVLLFVHLEHLFAEYV